MKVGEKVALRDAFGQALLDLAPEYPELIVLDADVSSSTRTNYFGQKYPQRFFNVGVAEANMADIASGMATCGLRPVISSFALFLVLKAADQIRNVICYNNLPVIIGGGYGGLSDSFDGASHQAVTDIAFMRALPNMRVIVPADASEIRPAIQEALHHKGPTYIRLCRNATPVMFETGFATGQARLIDRGSDVTLAACGITTAMAIEAKKILAAKGISAEVLEFHTIKPIDTKAVTASVKKTGCLVSVEEHTILGGLGSALAEITSALAPVPLVRVGIKDTFTESGPYPALLEKYGLTARAVVEAARQAVMKKNKKEKT